MKLVNYIIPAIAVLASTTANASANEAKWDGPYIGLHAGYNSMEPDLLDGTDPRWNLNSQMEGASGGVLTGYNTHSSGVVLGLEADFGLTGTDAGVNPNAENHFVAFKAKWNGHLRARVGVPLSKTLIFAAGGLAATHLKVYDEGVGEKNHTLTGFTIGGGVEHAVSERLSVRAEYLYDNYGKKAGTVADTSENYPYTVEPKAHSLRAAVAYRF